MEDTQVRTEVEKLLAEIKEVNITFENYKKYFDKVRTAETVISAQIENIVRNFKTKRRAFNDKKDEDKFKNAYNEGFVPRESFDLIVEMLDLLSEAYSWKTIEAEMYHLIFDKLYSVLDDAKVLEIKRDALTEMREMETKRNEMFLKRSQADQATLLDVLNVRIAAIDDKFMAFIRMMQQQHINEIKELQHAFVDALNVAYADKKLLYDRLNAVATKTSEAETQRITTPVGRVNVAPVELPKPSPKKKLAPIKTRDPFGDIPEAELDPIPGDDDTIDDDEED